MVALIAAGIEVPQEGQPQKISYTQEECDQIHALAQKVRMVLAEQSRGWKQRSVFEQQWLIRSFKKNAGMTVEEWLQTLERLEQAASRHSSEGLTAIHTPLKALAGYYGYMYEMGKGYIKEPQEREKNLAIVRGWQEDAEALGSLLKK